MSMRKVVFLVAIAACSVATSFSEVTITGSTRWRDRKDVQHLLVGARVLVMDSTSGAPLNLEPSYTVDDGTFRVTINDPAAPINVKIQILTEGEFGSVTFPDSGQPYKLESPDVFPAAAGGAVRTGALNLAPHGGQQVDSGDQSLTIVWAFSVHQAMVYARLYAKSLGEDPSPITVNFPIDGQQVCGAPVSCFRKGKPDVNILFGDKWDWDVMMHEYGHYISFLGRIDDNPGGAHYMGAHLENTYPDSKEIALKLAWGEGWPTFFSITAQKSLALDNLHIPFVGDSSYDDTEDIELHVDLASEDITPSVGEDDELSVGRILYAIANGSAPTHGAAFHLTDKSIWLALKSHNVATLWDGWVALIEGQRPYRLASVGAVFADHAVAPARLLPDDAEVDDSPTTFSWTGNDSAIVSPHPNKMFKLTVYNDTWDVLFEVSGLSAGSYSPSPEQWAAIKGANSKNVYWLVSGVNPDQPATGPYVSYAGRLRQKE